jgi:hypothetical protein
VLWLFGLAFGIVLQRSRFCFASGFRDLFLFGEGRVLKGIIIGMAVATVGFSLLMGKLVPDPSAGAFPARAGVYPLGYQTFAGGLLFGWGWWWPAAAPRGRSTASARATSHLW